MRDFFYKTRNIKKFSKTRTNFVENTKLLLYNKRKLLYILKEVILCQIIIATEVMTEMTRTTKNDISGAKNAGVRNG